MKPDSISLEIAIARIDREQADHLSELWEAIDEQGISVERRRAMDVNGMRCGIASSQMPPVFQAWIAADSPSANRARLTAHQLIQNGFGEIHPMEVTATVPALHWKVLGEDQAARSGSCQNATCLFDLRTYPLGNGTVEMEVCPKIRHGMPRPKLASENNIFTLTPLCDEIAMTEVAFGCRLKPGETLIIGPTSPPIGLGRLFLDGMPDRANEGANDAANEVRLVLIRLARTQMDDLFSPQKLSPPLATPSL